jgi:hypothetical protein
MGKTKSYSHKDFARNIEAISGIVNDAAANFEVFNCCRTDSQQQKYELVFALYPSFFSTIVPASLVTAVTTVYKFFDGRPEAVSLEKVIRIAESTKVIDAAVATGLRTKLASLNSKPVTILRNQALSHRNDTKTLEKIFAEAKLTPGQLEELFISAAEIVNSIRRAAGLSDLAVSRIGDVVHTDTDNLLVALATTLNNQK